MFKLLIVDDESIIRRGLRAYAERLWAEELVAYIYQCKL